MQQSHFAHPVLRLAFTAPPGFRLRNGPEAVVGTHKSGAVMRFDGAALERPSISTRRYLTDVWAPDARLAEVERITVDGLEAVSATTRIDTKSGARDVRLVAIRVSADQVSRFLFLTPPQQTRAFGAPFRRLCCKVRLFGDVFA